jgi:hypothetical protein
MSENNVRKIDRPILPMNHMEHLDEVEPEKVSDDFFIKIKSVNTSKQFTKIQSFSENSVKNIFLEKDSFSANHSLNHSYEKNKNISEDDLERTTNVISLRIPSKHYILYRKMSYRQKYMLKLGLISLIESLSGVSQSGPVFINMNIDMNMLMNKIDSENLEVLKEKLDLYKDKLKICSERLKMMRELEKEIERLKFLENEAKRALEMYRQRKITSETIVEIIRRALEGRQR